MERLQEETAYDIPGETNRYHYQPRGISLIISPWNFPPSDSYGDDGSLVGGGELYSFEAGGSFECDCGPVGADFD